MLSLPTLLNSMAEFNQHESIGGIKQDIHLIDAMHDSVQQAIVLFNDPTHNYPTFCNDTMRSLVRHENDLLVALINADIAQSSFDEDAQLQHRTSKKFVALDHTAKTMAYAYDILTKIEDHTTILLSQQEPFSQIWYNLISNSAKTTVQKNLIKRAIDNYTLAHNQLTHSS